MATIQAVTVEAADPGAAQQFYDAAPSLGQHVRVRGSNAPTDGFRGFTLSLVVPRPADVDQLMHEALEAGATALSRPKKSLWGYGGSFRAPDGAVWTLASSAKKDSGPATGQVDEFIIQLGVDDVGASKRFYAERGFTVAKSYGRKYVQLDTGSVTLALLKRKALAKAADIAPDGSGSHRLVVSGDAGSFIDPDGFAWE